MNTPPQIGPWLIHSVIGQGGMGVVYEAEHTGTGAAAALKTIRRGRRTSITAIRREIAALEDLRHPGIVGLLETGVDDGRPWYAMEYVSGTTLGDAIAIRQRGRTHGAPATRDLPAVAEVETDNIDVFGLDDGLRDLLGALGQVCHALAYLHGMGRAHLDLKPANILLEHRGRAVLVDFGVAVCVGGRMVSDAVSSSGLWAGTARYTAPERLAREPFDARADLFAVGCLLFEILTGRPVWYSNTVDDAQRDQAQRPCPRPSEHVVVPPALDALVEGLLAPLPADRVGHALEVVRVLEGLGIDTGATREITAPRPYLYDSGVAGREAELEVLGAAMDRAVDDGRGTAAFITGVAGVGKTRLAAEVARMTRAARGVVLTGECARPATVWGKRIPPRPFQLFEQLVRFVSDTFAAQPGDRRPLAGVGHLLARCFPFVADGHVFEPSDEPPREQEIAAALIEVVELLVADRTALFVFDDLQWADPMSLRVLEVLAQTAQDRSWLVLGMARTEEGNDRTLDPSNWTQIPLRRLGDPSIDALIRAALGAHELPTGLAEELVYRSRGIPLVACEFLQYALARGDLGRDDRGRWAYAMPSATEGTEELRAVRPDDSTPRVGADGLEYPRAEFLSERLAALGAPERLTVEAAATLRAHEIDVDTLHAITGLPDGKFGSALATLARSGFLRTDDPWNARTYVFTNEQLCVGIRDQIPEGAAVRLHRACAEALALTDADPSVLAAHWEAAGALEAAARASAHAAARACAVHQWERAEQFAERALRHLGPADPQALALRVTMGGATAVRGRVLAALGELDEIVGLARDEDVPSVYGRALLARSRIHARRGDLDAATMGWIEAIRVFREHGDRLGEADALTALGAERVARGRWEAAAAPLGQAEQLHQELGNHHGLARVLQLRGTVASETGTPTQAKAHLVCALRIASEHGFIAEEAAALCGLADVDTAMGRQSLARDRYERALSLLRNIGAVDRAGLVLWKLACVHLNHGRLDMADEVVILAEDSSGDPVLGAHLNATRGAIFTARGRLDDATGLLDDALQVFERHELRAEAIDARIKLGANHAAAGRAEAAISIFKHAGQAIATHELRRLRLPHMIEFAHALAIGKAFDGAARRAERAVELARASRQRREEAWAHYVVARVMRATNRDAHPSLRAARRLAVAVHDPVLVGLCRAERLHTMPIERAAAAIVELSETAVALGCTQTSLLGKAIRDVARERDLSYARLDHRTGHHRPTLRAKALDDGSRSVPI